MHICKYVYKHFFIIYMCFLHTHTHKIFIQFFSVSIYVCCTHTHTCTMFIQFVFFTQNRLFMHLTNYSVNKRNELYDKNMAFDTGSKRSIRYFNEYLQRSDIDVSVLWRRIADIIVDTLLVAQPHVLHAYRMCRPGVLFGSNSVCFEILGFDIMIDRKLQPWLLEVTNLSFLYIIKLKPYKWVY